MIELVTIVFRVALRVVAELAYYGEWLLLAAYTREMVEHACETERNPIPINMHRRSDDQCGADSQDGKQLSTTGCV